MSEIAGRMTDDVPITIFLEQAREDGQKGHVEDDGPAEEKKRKEPALADDRYAEMRCKIQCRIYGLQNRSDVQAER